ncbi:MAG: hypothetical protein LBP28_05665 [Coriobacteriales bacterium]|nr:hypothetical protein [Coriobacteriales bacterium]
MEAEESDRAAQIMQTTIAMATATGDTLTALEALAMRIARRLDHSSASRDVAQLARQYLDVMNRIEELKATRRAEARRSADGMKKETTLHVLKAKQDGRKPGAHIQPRAKVS